jgi:glycine oxidase
VAAFDVIVVGGGAIGAACGRELASAGRRVLILDPGGDMGQAWRAAGGMLAPQIEGDGNDPLFRFGVAARDHYASLAGTLRDTTGIDIDLWRGGIARVASDEVEARVLQAKVAWQQQEGHASEWLEPDQVRRRWPWLGFNLGMLWAPSDGALDPQHLVRALLADAHRLGAEIVTDRVIRIQESNSRVKGVSGKTKQYAAGEVVLAAGAWSGLIGGLPRPLPVHPVRGQMAALPWPAGVDRAIVYHKDCYILARGDEAILGSTMEYVGFRPEVTSAGLAKIFAAAMSLSPGLLRARVLRTWAGLRPMTPDGLPIIGADPELEGLWYATGHGRNGILLAGLTGVLVGQLLGGDLPSIDLSAFMAQRFGTSASDDVAGI